MKLLMGVALFDSLSSSALREAARTATTRLVSRYQKVGTPIQLL